MRKILIGSFCLALLVCTAFGGASGVSSTATKMVPPGSHALRDAQVDFNADVITELDRVVGTVGATEVTVDGKYAAVGSDATTGVMIQFGSCTNGETITFSPVFGATPRVVGNHSVDAGADAVIEFTGTTATTTVVTATSAKTIDYIAIGARP